MKSVPKKRNPKIRVRKIAIPWPLIVFLAVATGTVSLFLDKLPNRQLSNQTPGFRTELGCVERLLDGERWETKDTSIRLRGKFCKLPRKLMRSFEGITISNLSTGTESTAFLQGTSFASDDLLLQRGKNLVKLQWREKHDAPLRTWSVEIYNN